MAADGGYSQSEYREKEAERAALQPLRSACGLCGKAWEGTAGEVINKAREHRMKKHPEAVNSRKRRHVRALSSFRYVQMDEESKNEIEVERQRRARLHGVEIE